MTDKSIDELLQEGGYRKGVGMVLYKNGKVFFAERADAKGAWQFPQGGVDEEEDLLDAARRELFEETALTREQMELKAVYSDWTVYTLPEAFQKGKNGRSFKGQIQKWFLFEFKEGDKAIDLTKAQDKEFSAWKWESRENVLSQVEDFRKPVYEKVFAEFSGIIAGSHKEESLDIDENLVNDEE